MNRHERLQAAIREAEEYPCPFCRSTEKSFLHLLGRAITARCRHCGGEWQEIPDRIHREVEA